MVLGFGEINVMNAHVFSFRRSPVDPSILDMILQPDNEVDTLKKHLAVLQNPISDESSIEAVVTALEEIDVSLISKKKETSVYE